MPILTLAPICVCTQDRSNKAYWKVGMDLINKVLSDGTKRRSHPVSTS